MRRKTALLCLVLLSLPGCRDAARQGYMELTGRVFIFNPRVATATYVVTLGILSPLPSGAKVEALFDNPAGGEKLKVEQKVFSQTGKIALESPSLLCIKKGRRYNFTIKLMDAQGTELQIISSSIESTLDQSVMPDAPLVVGPAYQPNPALKGNAAGKLPDAPKQKCPA